jgi:hypothetical protein
MSLSKLKSDLLSFKLIYDMILLIKPGLWLKAQIKDSKIN